MLPSFSPSCVPSVLIPMCLFPYPGFSVINRTENCQALFSHTLYVHKALTYIMFLTGFSQLKAEISVQCTHMRVAALPDCILFILCMLNKNTGFIRELPQ